MKVPDHPQNIQNETIRINETDWPILQIRVLPGKFSNATQLRFNWTFVSFTPTELQIQLNFEQVTYVSIHNSNPDFIHVQVFGYVLFANERGEFMQPEYQLRTKSLPRMDSKERIEIASRTSQ